MTEKEPQMLTTTQAAERLGVTRPAIQKLIETNRIPAKRFGRYWVLSAKDVDEYARTRKVGRPAKHA